MSPVSYTHLDVYKRQELACAALDQHDGNYVRKKVNAQAYCAAYVIGKRYGAEVSGFQFGKVAEMQANGQKAPQELRGFLNDVRQDVYKRQPEYRIARGNFRK